MTARTKQLRRSSRALAGALVLLPATSSAQTTERVSVSTGGAQASPSNLQGNGQPSISADGRYVAWTSDANTLVANDTNAAFDVFRRDRQSSTTERASLAWDGSQANGSSFKATISGDGRYVVFESFATNLVPGDTNGFSDVFARDMLGGSTVRISLSSSFGQANHSSGEPSISEDGSCVAFSSLASNLVAGDTNGQSDVFVRVGAVTERVSISSTGVQGNGISQLPALSADGRYVVFLSTSSNLVLNDTNGLGDVFVRDRQLGTTERVSLGNGAVQADGTCICRPGAVSADGRWVVFDSNATNLWTGDPNAAYDVFLRDRLNLYTAPASVSTGFVQGSWHSTMSALSSDGRCVVFYSYANNLVPGDTSAAEDVFLRDRHSGATERVSVSSSGAQADAYSSMPCASADGRYVAFYSYATNLVANDTNGAPDVFVRDRGDASVSPVICLGDGFGGSCPCSNLGATGHGCQNSAEPTGTALTALGNASLAADTMKLTCSGELPTALSILLQGDVVIAPVSFGDGKRCAGGSLKRLYTKNAVGGVVSVPQGPDPSISVMSATLGDSITQGATRVYQMYYRDPNTSYCPAPTGGTFNISAGLLVTWGS